MQRSTLTCAYTRYIDTLRRYGQAGCAVNRHGLSGSIGLGRHLYQWPAPRALADHPPVRAAPMRKAWYQEAGKAGSVVIKWRQETRRAP